MNLVNVVLLAKTIKFDKKPTHERDNFFRLVDHLYGRTETVDVCIQEGHILELINDSLVISDSFEGVFGHQSIKLLFCSLNLHINNPFVVILSAGFHFAIVMNRLQEDEIEKVHDDVNEESVEVDFANSDLHYAISHHNEGNDCAKDEEGAELENSRLKHEHQIDCVVGFSELAQEH